MQYNIDTYKYINQYKNLFLSILQPTTIEHYDLSLLKAIEQKDFDTEISEIDFRYPIYRYGYAGSGKTIIALKILQKLALNDKVVLFTCFNKQYCEQKSASNYAPLIE